jgi:long-subunit fatty acid transport protein
MAILAISAAACGLSYGQSTDEVYSVIQFNFSNPGARSLAMGGAFTARADDATAVYANPAGLTQLTRPQFSIEGRGWTFTNDFLDSGTLPGATFTGETDDSAYRPSFLSGMYPGRSERWTVGAFAHELSHFETEIVSHGVTLDSGIVRPISARLALDIQSYGVSAAGKLYVNADKTRSFSVGLTAAYSDFQLDSRTERLDSLRDAPETGVPGSEATPTDLYIEFPGGCCQFNNRGDVRFSETQNGSDGAFGFGVGLLWKAPRYSIGAVYRRNPEFDFTANSYERAVFISNPDLRAFVGRQGTTAGSGPWAGVFRVPDVLGVGVSVQPFSKFMITADWNRVGYSQLLDQTVDVTGTDGPDALASLGTLKPAQLYDLDDGNEFRLGLEYALSLKSGTAWFFRGGAWSDPDHQMRYVGTDEELRALYQPGSDEMHYSAGAGVRLRRFQIDFGADLSHNVDTVSLSAVFILERD